MRSILKHFEIAKVLQQQHVVLFVVVAVGVAVVAVVLLHSWLAKLT